MNFLGKMGWRAPVIIDGGLGTELIKGGLAAGKSTITQNRDNPALVLKVHRSYVEAGARAICANTFAGNITLLRSSGIEENEREYLIEGMRLAREAVAGTAVKVAGDIGPSGDFQREFNRAEAIAIFTRQAELMMAIPPDFFFLQTMFDLREALAALAAVKAVAGEIPVAAGMTFNRTKRGFFTVMGDPAVDAMKALQDAGADAVGSNCTLTPEPMLELYRNFRGVVEVTVIVQPNAGQPELEGGEIVYRLDPEEFAEGLAAIAREGAEIVGGCCGSTPEMIKMVKEKILIH